ncbi:MAG: metal ABC transporter ATP-binding protein [Opitutaceae bacterium]
MAAEPNLHSEPAIVRFRDVSVRYGRAIALERITVDIPCGSLTAILGPNGAGKSTFLRACLGWAPMVHGEIRIGDSHPQHALPRLAYLPQRQAIDWDFPITVREVVEQGRYPALGRWRRMGRADRALVDGALAELGLAKLAERQIRQLSGGQQQRVFLSRALAQGADIFLLDEPFAGLDFAATAELRGILRSWKDQGRTVLAAIHELDIARRSFSHAVLLNTRMIASGLVDSVLRPGALEETYQAGRPADSAAPEAPAAGH